METIGAICTRDVVIINKDASIIDATKLMREYHVGDVVITEQKDGKNIPIGILTDRDIVIEILAKEIDMNTLSIGDVMSFDLFEVNENAGIDDVLDQMRAKGIRRCPVIDAKGNLTGIVSTDDLLDYFADKLVDLAKLVQFQQKRESRTRR